MYVTLADAKKANVNINNCSILNQSSAGVYTVLLSNTSADVDTTTVLNITGSSILATVEDVRPMTMASVKTARITDSIIQGTDVNTSFIFNASGAGEILATNTSFIATIEAAQVIKKEEFGSIQLIGCTVQSAKGPYLTKIGQDIFAAGNVIDRVEVSNCTMEYTGSTGGHCLLLGPEATAPVVSNSYFYGPPEDDFGNLGIVAKSCPNVSITGCIVVVERGIYLKGNADTAIVIGNTVIAHGTYSGSACFTWSNAKDGIEYIPTLGTIFNNIFEATNSSYCMLFVDSSDTPDTPTSVNGMVFDYNCLYGDVLLRDGVAPLSYTTLPNLITYWQGFGGWVYANDTNSIKEDPQLDSNYLPRNAAVLSGGKPDAKGNPTSIGAVSESNSGSSGASNNGFF
jgi:hypothetical protein